MKNYLLIVLGTALGVVLITGLGAGFATGFAAGLEAGFVAGFGLALYTGAGVLFLAQTPQVLPPLQYLQLEQFLQAEQYAEPTHLPPFEQQLSVGGKNNERNNRSFIISKCIK